ncbi:hypothetical protein MKK84_30875 [Methylobacterium sp. E-065]|uniref:hypothetical protein n=1 Tax=Methylobacterium sp. E-065 TaxID=2836583 RepID=UPI001FBA3860|nr:hypothetical protein [Methylobacterium sp. E-065]MCJ2021765.1 hypothetical protein [Methylobacterium sp. E-065]
MLFLDVLEGKEERLSLFGVEAVRLHPSYERSLLGDMICALANMPLDHLKFGLFFASRSHSRRLKARCGSYPC